MKTTLRNRVVHSVTAAAALFGVSVFGYTLIEKYSPMEAVYMTIITLSTVGYGEVRPLTPLGRVFTALVILTGVIIIAVMFGTLTEYIVAGELAGTLKMRRLMRKINSMKEHYIICGAGKVGAQVAVEMQTLGLPCVVIDKDKTAIERCEQLSLIGIVGDATVDETLRTAGIDRARGFVAALKSDSDNVYVILSARSLNPTLTIVGRSTGEENSEKLRMAGADRAVSPYSMASYRIVNQLTRPHVTYFLDTAMRSKGLNLLMDEIRIGPGSPLVSQRMDDAEIRTRTGANILSILRGESHDVLDWSPELSFEAEDMLIVVGKPEELRLLAGLAGDTRFEDD